MRATHPEGRDRRGLQRRAGDTAAAVPPGRNSYVSELDPLREVIARTGAEKVQFEPILGYRGDVAGYPDLRFDFRAHRLPLLALWERNDPSFLRAGAMAYRRDPPDVETHRRNTKHFELETLTGGIAPVMRRFPGGATGPST